MPIMRDGKIWRKEWSRKFPSRYHQLFEAADQNKDGIVTGEEMTNEIRRRTDLNNDGIITQQEVRDAFRSGVFERPR
jgi:Ca2+-binding EF-hand superfamily protein